MLDLLKGLAKFNAQQDFALAIIQSTEGSTYRKSGALMLISSDLEYWGLISGGCLEGDILENCRQVFTEQQDLDLRYDMRGDEDLLWGMGLGCDGAVNLIIKFLPANQQHFGFFEVLSQVDKGTAFQMLIELDDKKRLRFEKTNKQKQRKRVNATESALSIPLMPPLNLLICGGSPDVPPVTALAKQLGWKTTVIDHRKDYTSEAKFPHANQILHIKRSQWNELDIKPFDAAVIMSHQFERDQAYLAKLIKSDCRYIGLLGPTKRRDKLLTECGTQFEHHEGRIFGPVGLDIGADSPETIALAIIAEIQAVQTNKKVGFCYQDPTR